MKTIKERAVDAFPFRIYAPAECMELLEEKKKLRLGYVRGATEQKAIDIEKACDVYRNELQELLDIFTRYGEMRGIEQLGDIISIDGSVLEFRKAMEGGEV